MSRESADAQSVVGRIIDHRQPPPKGCPQSEAVVWRRVVDSKPADWFGDDSLPVLREYCRGVVMCDVLADKVSQAVELDSPKLLRFFLELRDKECKRVALLATKLRLTQQSRYTPQAAGTANKKAVGKRPWER